MREVESKKKKRSGKKKSGGCQPGRDSFGTSGIMKGERSACAALPVSRFNNLLDRWASEDPLCRWPLERLLMKRKAA